MEKLGVIGGMGAEATSYYYDQVVRHTAATCDQEHIDMVVLSKSTMPDRTLAIKTGEHAELLATMKECARALEGLGCAHIAIPCNTSHYFYDQIPVVYEGADYPHAARVGALCPGRRGDGGVRVRSQPEHAVRAGAQDRHHGHRRHRGCRRLWARCEAAGVEVVYPSEKRQADVMSLIYDDVKAGREPDMDKFDRVMWEFARSGCDRVILACTELSVLKSIVRCPRLPLTPWTSWCASPSSAAAPSTACNPRPAKKGQVYFGRFYLGEQ